MKKERVMNVNLIDLFPPLELSKLPFPREVTPEPRQAFIDVSHKQTISLKDIVSDVPLTEQAPITWSSGFAKIVTLENMFPIPYRLKLAAPKDAPRPCRFSINWADEQLTQITDGEVVEKDFKQKVIIQKDVDSENGITRELQYAIGDGAPDSYFVDENKNPFSYEVVDRKNGFLKIRLVKSDDTTELTTSLSSEAKGHHGFHVNTSYNPTTGQLEQFDITIVPPLAHKDQHLPGAIQEKYLFFAGRSLYENITELRDMIRRNGVEVLYPGDEIAEGTVSISDALLHFRSTMEQWISEKEQEDFSHWDSQQKKEARNDAVLAAAKEVMRYFPDLKKDETQKNMLITLLGLKVYAHLPKSFLFLDEASKKSVLQAQVNTAVAESLAMYYQREQERSIHTTTIQFSTTEGAPGLPVVVTLPRTGEKSTGFLYFGKKQMMNGYDIALDPVEDKDTQVTISVSVFDFGTSDLVQIGIPRTFSAFQFVTNLEKNDFSKAFEQGSKITRNNDHTKQTSVKSEKRTFSLLTSIGGTIVWQKEQGAFIEESDGIVDRKVVYVVNGKLAGKMTRREKTEQNGTEKLTTRAFYLGKAGLEEYSRSYGLVIMDSQTQQLIEIVSEPTRRRQVTVEVDSSIGIGNQIHFKGSYYQFGPSNMFPFTIVAPERLGLPLSADGKIDFFSKHSLEANLEDIASKLQGDTNKKEKGDLFGKVKELFPYWDTIHISGLMAEVQIVIGLAAQINHIPQEVRQKIVRALERRMIAKVLLEERMPSKVPHTFYSLPFDRQVAVLEGMLPTVAAEYLADYYHTPPHAARGGIQIQKNLGSISFHFDTHEGIPMPHRMRFGKRYSFGKYIVSLEEANKDIVAIGVKDTQNSAASLVIVRTDIMDEQYEHMLELVKHGGIQTAFPVVIQN